jgi:hypothetical protein
MARIEWVAQRLENWALWSDRGRNGGQGFASQSAFLNIHVDCGGYREASIPVDEVEAAITDEAVSALKVDKPHLHATVVGYYIEGLTALGLAQKMDRGQSTIRANLAHADAVLVSVVRGSQAPKGSRAPRVPGEAAGRALSAPGCGFNRAAEAAT